NTYLKLKNEVDKQKLLEKNKQITRLEDKADKLKDAIPTQD
ncbi:27955_t:CDS:2, partial [Racocetra persica]